MSFFRPEAEAVLWRWREGLAGLAVGILGLWFVTGPSGLLAIPGYALLIASIALIWLGIQRGRFRGAGDGAGAVQVDEGQVTYFGPLTGGAIAFRDMERLSLEGAMFPAHWRLEQPGQQALLIPVNAAGAEALFDAFATLPGLRTQHMLSELQANSHQTVVIWEREGATPKPRLLH